jgi:hypothetical protein
MLIPLESKVDEPEFRRLLMKHFPELSEEIEDDEGLIHMQMGSLENMANRCIKAGELHYLKNIYEFIDDLARHQCEVHPDVINAINVSFLEGLNFENKSHGEAAKSMLTPAMRKMWEAQMDHNRKIGWLK